MREREGSKYGWITIIEQLRKNERHGPCKLTGKAVFGSNHFKDLTSEEFQSLYLTGYKGPHAHENDALTYGERAIKEAPSADDRGHPLFDIERHPSVQERYAKHWCENGGNSTEESVDDYDRSGRRMASRTYGYNKSSVSYSNIFSRCRWSMSCYLQYLFGSSYRNREPAYDSDSFPESFDWRNVGAVTSVRTQGSCGACWGITAVETIESAYFIKSGTLVNLAETEVILCDDTCDMCNGGWPQNAYEYAIEKKGLPSSNSVSYSGDNLYLITMVLAGESDEVDTDYVSEYMNGICPSKGGSSDVTRYAQPNAYGYATEKCLCYTSGEGCDCDDQDEARAIANIASFGPGTMCLDASTWQDYEGGIITADSGCSQEFLNMNHCVQVVGYAFTDDAEDDEVDDDDSQSGSGSGSGSGSRDYSSRNGYFIVRNQWSANWGMNGYAYVAMGNNNQNTCGSLNDITQVYFD